MRYKFIILVFLVFWGVMITRLYHVSIKSNFYYEELAKENIVKLKKDIRSERSIIGFLPILSDAFPNKGEKKNCIIAKEAIKIPSAVGPA